MERYDLVSLRCSDLPTDALYGSRFAYSDAALTESVRSLGVFMPLVVTRGPSPKVISGHRRLMAALGAGLTEIPALMIKDALSDQDCFRLALVSNWREARSELDSAWAVRQAKILGFNPSEILSEILPLLGVPSERHWINEFEALAALSAELLADLHEGRLPVRGASGLARFNAQEQRIFSGKIAGSLRLTSSQLMKTLEWLLDLTRSLQEPLEAVLSNPSLQAVLEDPQPDIRKKTDLFFKRLRELRFPRLSACEKDFEAKARLVEKGEAGLKIEAPPYFEEPGFLLRLKVQDPGSLDRLLSALADKRSSMRELFKIVL